MQTTSKSQIFLNRRRKQTKGTEQDKPKHLDEDMVA